MCRERVRNSKNPTERLSAHPTGESVKKHALRRSGESIFSCFGGVFTYKSGFRLGVGVTVEAVFFGKPRFQRGVFGGDGGVFGKIIPEIQFPPVSRQAHVDMESISGASVSEVALYEHHDVVAGAVYTVSESRQLLFGGSRVGAFVNFRRYVHGGFGNESFYGGGADMTYSEHERRENALQKGFFLREQFFVRRVVLFQKTGYSRPGRSRSV